jgi:hypothetical protein
LLAPTWDLRRSALAIGEMANKIDHATIPLFLSTREAILSHSTYGNWPLTMEHGQKHKFLRVIGNWERNRALTPPLLTMYGDKLSHWDGHHRIKIALMSGVPVIPFYSEDNFGFPGISRAPSEMHLESCWRASWR